MQFNIWYQLSEQFRSKQAMLTILLVAVVFCLTFPVANCETREKRNIDVQPCIDQLTNGCSIPLGLPFFYKEFFHKACLKHDVCYKCVSQNRFLIRHSRIIFLSSSVSFSCIGIKITELL